MLCRNRSGSASHLLPAKPLNRVRREGVAGGDRKAHLLTISGDNDEGVPPVPIPNTEVKPFSAESTWLDTAREDRSSPDPISGHRIRGVLILFSQRSLGDILPRRKSSVPPHRLRENAAFILFSDKKAITSNAGREGAPGAIAKPPGRSAERNSFEATGPLRTLSLKLTSIRKAAFLRIGCGRTLFLFYYPIRKRIPQTRAAKGPGGRSQSPLDSFAPPPFTRRRCPPAAMPAG